MLRLRSFVGLSLMLFAAPLGCGDDPEGRNTGSGDDAAADAAADVVIVDSSVDTGSEPEDTGSEPADTGSEPVDSTLVDSGTPDTGAPDTGTPDTGAPDTAILDTAVMIDAPMCTVASDCPGMDLECAKRACVAGKCEVQFVAAGTLTAVGQSSGDCKKRQCNGAGVAEVVYDPLDLPNDDNACTDDFCTGAVPTFMPRPAGHPCATGGGTMCDGAGACVQCLTASHCPGVDEACSYRACVDNKCSVVRVPSGSASPFQTAGDCQTVFCSAVGETGVTSPYTWSEASDVPPAPNPCMIGVCYVEGSWSEPGYDWAQDPCTSCGDGKICDYRIVAGTKGLDCVPIAEATGCVER